MAILVTGGAGFIGSNFVLEWLAQSTETVINLDKLTYAGNLENLITLKNNPQHIFIKGDIGDNDLVRDLLNQYKPRAILNFAAESHVDRSISNPDAFIETNILGTFHLLNKARDYYTTLTGIEKEAFRFLHVSTDEVYGSLDNDDPAFSETTAYQPNSPYSASKASSDHLVRAYHHTYGLPVLTTHCSNNYGPYQFPEKLIPLIIRNALAGDALPVYGTGENIRDWLYVTDHCAAIRCVLDKGKLGETYNIGGCNEVRNIDVVKTICAILDKDVPLPDKRSYSQQISFVTDRAGHDWRYAINAEKIEKELGWTPTETFTSGLEKTVKWYLDHPQWIANITSGAYRGRANDNINDTMSVLTQDFVA
jgi:dTDP-glucose 4,6-dehydratase